MFVAASSRCFADHGFFEACRLLTDLEFDKIELWFSEEGEHLRPSRIAAEPERFFTQYRESTRLTPVALCLEEDLPAATLGGLSRLAKMLRVTQITVPASPVGTPFNTEIDRLREFTEVTGQDGVRLSIKTKRGDLTEDPETAVELCQSVRGLGLTLDPSHYIAGPHRGKPWDRTLPHAYHVHLRDTTPEQLQVQVGLGEIDYSRLIGQLGRCQYRWALSVEIIPELSPDVDRALELRKLRMLLETLL